jgi:hypothetical protein
MSLTAIEHARTDSRVAILALVAVFSFALGIFASLIAAERPRTETAGPVRCPSHCPELILMSTGPAPIPNGICTRRSGTWI